MRPLLSRPIQVDPSFHIGLSLVVILAVAEIFAAASYYVVRARAARVSAQAVAPSLARPVASPVSATTPAPVTAQPAVSSAAVSSSPAPRLAAPLRLQGLQRT